MHLVGFVIRIPDKHVVATHTQHDINSVVGARLGRLYDQEIVIRYPAKERDLSFLICADWLWSPLSLLFKRDRDSIPEGRAARVWVLTITFITRTNKMHTFFINNLIKLYCLRDVSNNQVSWHRPDCLYGCMKKYHKTACANLPDDEHLVVRNMSKTIRVYLN